MFFSRRSAKSRVLTRGELLSIRARQKVRQRGIPGEDVQHVRGGGKQRGEARLGTVLDAPSRYGRRHLVDERKHVIDRLDDGLTQALAVTRQEPQPRIGAINGALDGRLDKRLRIVPACLAAAENGLEESQRSPHTAVC